MHELWDMLWIDARLVTCASHSYGIIDGGAIAIKDGLIAWVGKTADLHAKPEDLAKEIYSAKNNWLTPGLIDCHTHLVYAGNRSHEFELRLKGKSYEEIAKSGGGIFSTVKATRAASFDELYKQSAKRLEFLLVEGVTTIEIKSGYGLDLETEIKILQVAKKLEQIYPVTIKTTYLGAHAVPEEYKNKADDYIDFICQTVLPKLTKDNLVDIVDVFCENIGFNSQQTEKVFKTAQELKLPVKLHADQLTDNNGAGLAAKYKALSADHIEYSSEDSIRAMAETGTVGVLLPGAFYFLKEKKLPPIELLRKYKVPMAIATDCNPGTSPTTSLLLMLNMACTLFGLTPEEAFLGVTKHASKALGLEKTHGSLEVGKVADLILWEMSHPNELSYMIGFNPCAAIIKDGSLIANNL